MARLFAALRPPPAMRERLRATMHGLPGARWQSDEQLHLTVRFIGDVDRHRQADIAAALGRIHAPALMLGVEGVGAFDSKGRPNSLWAAIPAANDLTRIAKSVDRAMVDVGLAPETRAFRPHVTLARLGRDAMPPDGWLAVHAGLAHEPAPFTHLYLYESILGREGSTYVIVERYPLA
ncbi:RNA 2',3'-cyclic phosphodiesterase [Sphingomonas sp. AP4-R1]|uniref:RNA 2',3'-cyclic phosphodiesterase n=1 Tax=Sphingomonas sp. AP4-R1 TaxID=2735134 RepID=UPI001493C253|nr:RNA 2',3'-cyclic phosphodiesterase [Sphingomonas sp. AP4-R1]QJU57539.1 RNA 2',3'-cyclic phosphodiesterase [Sphingomonas sp. AP4-R1]